MTATENQQSIAAWAAQTYGPAESTLRAAARVNEHVAFVLGALAVDPAHGNAITGVVDAAIWLYVLADRLGVPLDTALQARVEQVRTRLEHAQPIHPYALYHRPGGAADV